MTLKKKRFFEKFINSEELFCLLIVEIIRIFYFVQLFSVFKFPPG